MISAGTRGKNASLSTRCAQEARTAHFGWKLCLARYRPWTYNPVCLAPFIIYCMCHRPSAPIQSHSAPVIWSLKYFAFGASDPFCNSREYTRFTLVRFDRNCKALVTGCANTSSKRSDGLLSYWAASMWNDSAHDLSQEWRYENAVRSTDLC